MLDSIYEKEYIFIQADNENQKIVDIIKDQAKYFGFDVFNANIENGELPKNIKGAFIFHDNTIKTSLLIGILSKNLHKVFIITEEEVQLSSDVFEICSPSYKRIEEKINKYIQSIRQELLNISITPTNGGFRYHTSGDIRINPYKGIFINIEKPDGAGGTTLQRNLIKFLQEEGLECFDSEEPTNEAFGGIIRTTLRGRMELYPDTMQLLYTLDRIEHSRLINNALKDGKIVVESRFALSTLMYAYKDLPLGFLVSANSRVYWPEINLLISNVDPKELIRRIGERIEGHEKFDNHEKLSKVTEGMSILGKMFNEICYEINGTRSPEDVTKQEIRIIKRHPKFKLLSLQKS